MEAALRTLEEVPLKGLNLRLEKVHMILVAYLGTILSSALAWWTCTLHTHPTNTLYSLLH